MILSWSMDSLGWKNTPLFLHVDEINQLGVNLYFHQSFIDTSTFISKMFFHTISLVESFERELERAQMILGLEKAIKV